MLHGVMIAPSAFQSAGNALGEALGHGPDTYSVPLYPATAESSEPTHYGAACPVSADFVALVTAAEQGIIPPELEALGYSGAAVQSLIQQLKIDFSNIEEEGSTHFFRVLGLLNLSMYPYYP